MSEHWVQKLSRDIKMDIQRARQENGRQRRRGEPQVKVLAAVAGEDAKNDNNIILLVGAAILAVAIVGVLFLKDRVVAGGQNYTQMSGYVNQEQLMMHQYRNDGAQYNADELYSRYEKYDANAKTFWENQTWTQDRLALLAIVVNHNTEVDRLGRPKSELIVLHQDWTISGFPYLVRMTKEDEAFVRQFMR